MLKAKKPFLFLLLLLSYHVDCHGVSTNKKLVFLAGPHQTSTDDMRLWFDQHASDYDDSATSSRLGGGWKWPTLNAEDLSLLQDEDVSRHSVFQLLFKDEKESEAPEILMKAIRENWETAEAGIILGHERFDKVGETPYSHMDALKVIYRIVEGLSIPREDVTIVLMYRTPRLRQWLSIWDLHSHHDDYKDFVCQGDEADKRQEYVATAMNIGLLSKDFLQNGFNVVVIDEEGTKRANLDLSHTLACNVLNGVECTHDGWIVGLRGELTLVDQEDDSQYQEWTELTLQQLHDLESVFLQRDCVYQSELERHESFRVLNQNALFSKCEVRGTATKEKFMDAGYIVDFIQMQCGCESASFDPSAILPGAPDVKNGQEARTGRGVVGEYFLFILLLILCVSFAALAYLLYKNQQKHPPNGERDGLFTKSASKNCFFRKRRNSEGSTESSTDEETPPPSPSKGMMDVSLSDSPPLPSSLELCKACKLVRIDPKCPFCRGGQPFSRPSNVFVGSRAGTGETSGPDAHPKGGTEFKDSWHAGGSSMSWGKDDSAVVSIDDFTFGTQPAELSPRKSKDSNRSRAFRKLKELAKLKRKSDDEDDVLNPGNLQMDRDDESVISFS